MCAEFYHVGFKDDPTKNNRADKNNMNESISLVIDVK